MKGEMQTGTSATMRNLSRRVGGLGPDDLEAYHVITEAGPIMELGDVHITADVWSRVPRKSLWFAIDLHQCGYWGRVCDIDYENNDKALAQGGNVSSRWMFSQMPTFWIKTKTAEDGNKTSVFVGIESL